MSRSRWQARHRCTKSPRVSRVAGLAPLPASDAIAVGSSAEGDRCFVVLNLIDEVPPVLVSFGLWASDDWWEGVLSLDAASWKDGFVLDLPR